MRKRNQQKCQTLMDGSDFLDIICKFHLILFYFLVMLLSLPSKSFLYNSLLSVTYLKQIS